MLIKHTVIAFCSTESVQPPNQMKWFQCDRQLLTITRKFRTRRKVNKRPRRLRSVRSGNAARCKQKVEFTCLKRYELWNVKFIWSGWAHAADWQVRQFARFHVGIQLPFAVCVEGLVMPLKTFLSLQIELLICMMPLSFSLQKSAYLGKRSAFL